MRWWSVSVIGLRALVHDLLRWKVSKSAPWRSGALPALLAASLMVGAWAAPVPVGMLMVGWPTLVYGLVVTWVHRRNRFPETDGWLAVAVGAMVLGVGWAGLDVAAGQRGVDPMVAALGRSAAALAVPLVLTYADPWLRGIRNLVVVAVGIAVAYGVWFMGCFLTFLVVDVALYQGLDTMFPMWVYSLQKLWIGGFFWLSIMGLMWLAVDASVEVERAGRAADALERLGHLMRSMRRPRGGDSS